MPSQLDIGRAVDAQTSSLERIVRRLASSLVGMFGRLDKYDARAVEQYRQDAARLTYEAQRAAAGATTAYLDASLRAMGIAPPFKAPIVKVDLRGLPQQDVAERVVSQYRWHLSEAFREQRRRDWLDEHPIVPPEFGKVSREGITPPAFGMTPEKAEQFALNRIQRNAHDDVRLADRTAADDFLAEAGIKTYRRVIHPEWSVGGTCGMCIAASDRIYNVGELLPIHDNCKCTVAAISDDDDPGYRLNRRDLDAMYEAAGGKDRASLKRTRYKIDEHGELGPVLVPKRRESKNGSKVNKPPSRDLGTLTPEKITAQVASLEQSLAALLAREAAGEDVAKQIAWQRNRISELRKK